MLKKKVIIMSIYWHFFFEHYDAHTDSKKDIFNENYDCDFFTRFLKNVKKSVRKKSPLWYQTRMFWYFVIHSEVLYFCVPSPLMILLSTPRHYWFFVCPSQILCRLIIWDEHFILGKIVVINRMYAWLTSIEI